MQKKIFFCNAKTNVMQTKWRKNIAMQNNCNAKQLQCKIVVLQNICNAKTICNANTFVMQQNVIQKYLQCKNICNAKKQMQCKIFVMQKEL